MRKRRLLEVSYLYYYGWSAARTCCVKQKVGSAYEKLAERRDYDATKKIHWKKDEKT